MKKTYIEIKGKSIPVYTLDALVIGSGCAGYNAADWLYDLGVSDVAIATEDVNCGTSRNTGSDKQTYYKLSLSSSENDSVMDMCRSLFEGKSVNGDTALSEAACSVRSFIKLVNLGVPFPTNEYGEFVGYMTDHDSHRRATSVGPLTSKYMTEALQKSVERKNITIFDKTFIIKLICNKGKVVGALGIDKTKLMEETHGLTFFSCSNIVMATGGPAGIYYDSVYPVCHKGMSSVAIEAGAGCANLQEWQYGLASVDFRWNVSGTYQQVIPRYISVDKEGREYEFLNDYFQNPADAVNNVFKKGYQWPFDSAKIQGSSIIDLIIYNETVNKNRRVYMDFRREPSALESGFTVLSEEAYTYLKNSDALIPTPIKRLEKMNPKAIELYRTHGIDLYTEPLRVAVCAQHNNGGVAVDSNWQSDIEGLYVAGEAAGTFGVYRPGGSALNSTQVGSLRAAEAIALKYRNGLESEKEENDILTPCMEIVDFVLSMGDGKAYLEEIKDLTDKYAKRMSAVAAHIRIPSEMEKLMADITEELSDLFARYKSADICNVINLYRLKDVLITQKAVLSAMLKTAAEAGSRGGSVVSEEKITDSCIFSVTADTNTGYDDKVFVTYVKDGVASTLLKDIRPIPQTDMWFENVWNQYNKKWNIK